MSKDSLQGVFEEVNVSGVLRYFPGRRRRVDEGPSISLSKQSEKIENRNKDKKSIKQPKSTGAKLATLFSSFFKQSILKKKSKSTTVTKEDACTSRSSISFPHVIKNTWKDKCVALDSERDQDCHEERVKNERSKSVDGNSTNKWLLDMDAKLWSEALFRKEERRRWRKSEEEDEGSESSSDLFELQNYDSIDGVSTNL